VSEIPEPKRVKLGKMGNSLRMTIPTEIAWALDLKPGDYVEVNVNDSEMIVSKAVGGEEVKK